MILIRDVEIVNVSEDIFKIVHFPEYPTVPFSHENAKAEDFSIEEEIVRGTRFVNNRGEEVVIGMSKKVQEAIGLPMSVFEGQEFTIESLSREVSRLRKHKWELHEELLEFKHMDFWKRLKFFITRR